MAGLIFPSKWPRPTCMCAPPPLRGRMPPPPRRHALPATPDFSLRAYCQAHIPSSSPRVDEKMTFRRDVIDEGVDDSRRGDCLLLTHPNLDPFSASDGEKVAEGRMRCRESGVDSTLRRLRQI